MKTDKKKSGRKVRGGQCMDETQSKDAPGNPGDHGMRDAQDCHVAKNGDGHSRDESQKECAIPNPIARKGESADSHFADEAHQPFAVRAPSPIIDEIRSHHRAARFAMKQVGRLERALEAFICRDFVGLAHDADEKTRKAAWAETKRLIAECQTRNETQHRNASAIGPFVQATEAAAQPFKTLLSGHEKAMAKLAKTLPVWTAWGESLHGFGEKGLAQILGESGDLSNYANVAKLWKRLGLAVMDGKRQGKPGEGASAETWIAHGYSPERRSIIWNIGQSLFKAQSQRIDEETGEILREAGPYRKIYDAEKLKQKDRVKTAKHAHNRAMRYMEKRFIADLWSAWREASHEVKPIQQLSPAEALQVPANASVPSLAITSLWAPANLPA